MLFPQAEPVLETAVRSESEGVRTAAMRSAAAARVRSSAVGHRWRTTLAAAGLTGVKLHDLRHFYASGLIASGCDVVTVQRALGHASATTTLNTYSHLWPTAEDRTRRAAEELFADSCGLGADSATSTSR